jgi:cytosine/adenosine deaminase-related metal-dependent hydrolase
MDWKSVLGKVVKGALSGAMVAIGTLQVTGNLNADAWKGMAFAVASAALHGGWEAVKQLKTS